MSNNVLVNINKMSLGQIVAGALSALNVEGVGALLGEMHSSKKNKYFEIQGIQLFQFCDRKPASVHYYESEFEKTRRFNDVIGRVHWHIRTKTTVNGKNIYENGFLKPGKSDRDFLRYTYPKSNGVELIAALNLNSLQRQLTITPNELIGSIRNVGNLYEIRIGAFYMYNGITKRALLDLDEEDVVSVFAS
jgi:hypothetical protein